MSEGTTYTKVTNIRPSRRNVQKWGQEITMKKLALAAALSVVASSAFAGGYVAPPVLPEILIVEDAGSSAGGILVPAIAVLLLVLALHHY